MAPSFGRKGDHTELDRSRLKRNEFAIPEKRAYPIPDRLHASLALDDANPVIPARERRGVSTRFPELAVDAAHDQLREVSACVTCLPGGAPYL
jgi:hypothetical protein